MSGPRRGESQPQGDDGPEEEDVVVTPAELDAWADKGELPAVLRSAEATPVQEHHVVVWEPPINKGEAVRVFTDENKAASFRAELEATGWPVKARVLRTSEHMHVAFDNEIRKATAERASNEATTDEAELLRLAEFTLRWHEENPDAHINVDRLRMAQIIVRRERASAEATSVSNKDCLVDCTLPYGHLDGCEPSYAKTSGNRATPDIDIEKRRNEAPSEDVLRMVLAFGDEGRRRAIRELAARVKATETELASLRRESAIDLPACATPATLIKALILRIYGLIGPGPAHVSFTHGELARASQAHFHAGDDGARMTVSVRRDT